jgi:hypothetical protein
MLERAMTDEKAAIERQLRLTGHHDDDDEARIVAEANGITREQARDLLGRFGNFRSTLEREAKKLRGSSG